MSARRQLDADIRRAGFYGYIDCPHASKPDGCPTPYLCSERGDCPAPISEGDKP